MTVEELFILIQKTYGIAGLILAAPMVTTVFLWLENKSLTRLLVSKTEAAQAKLERAHTQRVDDTKAIMDKLMQLVSEQSSINEETNNALGRIEERIAIRQLAKGRP